MSSARLGAPGGVDRRLRVIGALASARLKQSRDVSVVGILKWLLEPLSYMAVYFVLVAVFLDRPSFAYPLFLLCALVPWRYFTGVVGGSMALVSAHAAVITNRAFPRDVLPLVLVATEGANLLVALTLFAPMMAWYGIAPRPSMLWVPALIAILAVLSAGPAYLGGVFGLYFPEYRPLVQNLIRMGFFVSTGLVSLRHVPAGRLTTVLRLNPLSGVFDSFRAVVIDGRAPLPFDLLYPLAVGGFLLAVGVPLYRWREREFAKEV